MRQSRRFKASASVERAGGAFSPMWNNLAWLAARQASISRNDSRHVSCAKAMTRNRSAQPSVRTPASPLCRSMIRPKVLHGTNSIAMAEFAALSGSRRMEFLRLQWPQVGDHEVRTFRGKQRGEVEIVDVIPISPALH